MRNRTLLLAALMVCAASFAEDKTIDLSVGDAVWAKTVVTPYDHSSKESREATFKVYTHIMDFAGKAPITKGLGGLYPHHRGLFIGWRETTVGDKKYDTWHMTDCYQQYTGMLSKNPGSESAPPAMGIEWRGNDGTAILSEERAIKPSAGSDGSRVFDFTSVLTSQADVKLRGDSHHAGMQVRLSNEVAEHQDATV